MITITEIQRWQPVVEAVLGNKRVTLIEDGRRVMGTLRAFTPAKDDPCYARPTADLDQLWVRITTSEGWEMWIKALVLAERHANGMVGFS